ncbi:glutathione S-transferase family protein [Sorangium sp. So ce362]|uniref:glutathione S-transferase family protein n=1 Tax=Sorangium sp. So ce362 TaxID=3133303 RepID=UPI003F6161A1
MITLYQGPAAWGIPNISPFCVKLETWLRMAGLPYEVRAGEVRGAPKGKIPHVEIDGRRMGDSQLIIEHLERVHGDRLDAHLAPEARARGHVIRRMLDEAFYWVVVYARWVEPDAWAVYRPIILSLMPPVIGGPIVELIRRRIKSMLRAQGTGLHSREEVYEMGKADLTALAALLGDQPFMLGAEPSSVDATVYAFLVSVLRFPADSPVKRHAEAQPHLVAYCERMRQRYYADWKPGASRGE